MNALIVDDDNIVINELLNDFDWKSVSINNIKTSSNIIDAMKILSVGNIQIVICDIEMPNGSGIDLLRWLKESSSLNNVNVIFLTCHAEFGYAKEAISLGCMEYLLKPVLFDDLKKAILKIEKKISDTSYAVSDHDYFYLAEKFWLEIIRKENSAESSFMIKNAKKYEIPYASNTIYCPILIHIRRWNRATDEESIRSQEFCVKNICNEIMLDNNRSAGCLVEIMERSFVIILYSTADIGYDISRLSLMSSKCIEECNKTIHCDLCFYIGQAASISTFSQNIESLVQTSRDNVSYENHVFYLNNSSENPEDDSLPDISSWAPILLKGNETTLMEEVDLYFNKLRFQRSLNAQTLKKFYADFEQLVFIILKDKNISAGELLEDKEAASLSDTATHSIYEMKKWVACISRKIYSTESDDSQTIPGKVREYIKNHMEEDLTRESISREFYINPDYLDRLFKKKTGMSVKRYIIAKRIDMAQKLLLSTDISVSSIAASVGYKNLSQFSIAFHKQLHMSPSEFRNNPGIPKTKL